MKDKNFYDRMAISAKDFVLGVQPALEKQMGVTVHPIEDLESSKLIKSLDQRGIDAFYYDRNGDMRGLASRLNYSEFSSSRPAFTFRYKLWDERKGSWDENREYARKLHAANSPEEFIMFPKVHVESFSRARGSGDIGWSFAARTKDIMIYIRDHLENPEKVRVFTPRFGEKRQVVCVPIEVFARDNLVTEIHCSN